MYFSLCILGIFSLVLHDICLASVFMKYEGDAIAAVYAGRKQHDRHLAHLATLTEEQRSAVCNFHIPGEYVKNDESIPHMYKVDIPESAIPKKESGEEGASKSESPKATAKGKEAMGVEPTVEELQMEKLKLKGTEQEKLEQEKPEPKQEEKKSEPDVIYDEEIGFRCQPTEPTHEPFIISYGFAQETYFVSEPVGQIDKKKEFSGRKMKLRGYMFAPPILQDLKEQELHQKYYELRERTEKVRDESATLMEDIETHDDISALMFEEKNILCASIMDVPYYKNQELKYVPAEDPLDYKYSKLVVGFPYEKMDRTFPTEFMKCKAKKGDDRVTIGVTRSYAEGGDVFISRINEKLEKQLIDVEVVKIPVLFNRKYAGGRKGVLEVLETIRGK